MKETKRQRLSIHFTRLETTMRMFLNSRNVWFSLFQNCSSLSTSHVPGCILGASSLYGNACFNGILYIRCQSWKYCNDEYFKSFLEYPNMGSDLDRVILNGYNMYENCVGYCDVPCNYHITRGIRGEGGGGGRRE